MFQRVDMCPTFYREHHSLAAPFQINRPHRGLFGGVNGSWTQLDFLYMLDKNTKPPECVDIILRTS